MIRKISLIAACALLFASLAPLAATAQDDTALADYHKKVGKLACRDCHGATKPESLTPEAALNHSDKQCMACHGTMANVAAKITPKLANKHINPHAGHIVGIQCVTCHSGHEESEAYCVKCHAFEMPMNTGKPKK